MNKTNKNLTFKGNPIKASGTELKVGDALPAFSLTGNDMADVTNEQFRGKILVLSVVPSLDTPVCSAQTKRFNEEASEFGADVAILTVSMDLPFAQARWCGAEGVSNVKTASDYKRRTFGAAFGTTLDDLGLLARSVFVADKTGTLVHVEYVQELSAEPEYDAALKAIRALL